VLPLGWRSDASEVVTLSAPDLELLSALQRPVSAPVVVDMGSEEATHVELDGWAWPTRPWGTTARSGRSSGQ
jgi:hypothetical protein